MTLLQLKYICTVAECGSFSRAAQVLYVSQPGISKMVRAMEEELGITIFVRNTAGITLTSEGKELVSMGTRLLRDADRITQHFEQEAGSGHELLQVSSQHFCFVIDAFYALQKASAMPSYTYRLHIGQTGEVIQQVAGHESEIGVLFIGEHNRKLMDRMFRERDLEYHEFLLSRPYVFLHESHPLAGKKEIDLPDLAPYPCITYALNPELPTVLQEELLPVDFFPEKIDIVNSLYQSVQIMTVCHGYDLGTGVISESNRAMGIVKRPIRGYRDPISIGWIRRKSQPLSPLGERFVLSLENFKDDIAP